MNVLYETAVDKLLSGYFDEATLDRGRRYYFDGHVQDIDVVERGYIIEARVSGTRNKRYRVHITLPHNTINRTGLNGIRCHCSCPVSRDCKHAVAVLFEAREFLYNMGLLAGFDQDIKLAVRANHRDDERVSRWLDETAELAQKKTNGDAGDADHVVQYVLSSPAYDQSRLAVDVMAVRKLKAGGLGKQKRFSATAPSQQAYLNAQDKEILMLLRMINGRSNSELRGALELDGAKSSECLAHMVETGRCFSSHESTQPLVMGPERKIDLLWQLNDDGLQTPKAVMDGNAIALWLLDEAWYVCEKQQVVGRAISNLQPEQIRHFLKAPPLPPGMAKAVHDKLAAVYPQKESLLPKVLDVAKPKQGIKPKPIVHLDFYQEEDISAELPYYVREIYVPEEIPIASVYFDYDGYVMPFNFSQSREVVEYVQDGAMRSFQRNLDDEKKWLQGIGEFLQLKIYEQVADKPGKPSLLEIGSFYNESLASFCLGIIPGLEQAGWQVVIQHPRYSSVLEEDDVEWYSELDDESSYDYFQFHLGIEHDGEKIDVLPVVADLIKRAPIDTLDTLEDDDLLTLALPNEKILVLPYERIKPMVQILVELYDSEQQSYVNGLKLSKHKAVLLAEMQKAFKAVQMRWFGGERIRKLSEKISRFEKIDVVEPPAEFTATLRPYQQHGVDWLQFLRQFELSGILADDMGLGKTVQTLAHLSIEKSQGRMTLPSLIVAPTSLMVNWKNECQRFAPSLNVLVFQGADRKEYAATLTEYDIVLTTYPLLSRDSEILLGHTFHYLILDEAQNIKNHKAKSTQIALQLQANHRLCLTGTPMENHLGELWSLFHFLMPGLLGDSKAFRRLFRTPIEKHGDQQRQSSLNMRIKPFLLRRQKSEVVKELPEKTEIIRTVALQGAERDLYESIRLSMEKKVRDAIKNKGMARSHIVILDALLKLRQVCCHSKLLKLDSAEKAHKHSSKLDLLAQMLPEMVEEGRRILIFSQFTTMLQLIEEVIIGLSINYVKLTGRTRDRETPINAFQSGDVPIFLISLKAGGTGLNLTAADTVIHYDPWWNPAAEDQATDRAHRIGQKNKVFVYKLLTEGTVEQTILQMQQKKRALIEGVFDKQQASSLKLTGDDLNQLFQPL